MAPASVTHGIIQANVVGLLRNHLVGSHCYVVVAPGVIPRVRSEDNLQIPDVVVSCETDDQGLRALTEPTLVVEILSTTNRAETRENVWAYATIPTVREILLIRSTRLAAELIRREADGTWPAKSRPVGAEGGIGLGKPRFLLPVSSRLRRHAPGARDRRGLISAAAAFRRDRGRRTGGGGNAAPPDVPRGRYWRGCDSRSRHALVSGDSSERAEDSCDLHRRGFLGEIV